MTVNFQEALDIATRKRTKSKDASRQQDYIARINSAGKQTREGWFELNETTNGFIGGSNAIRSTKLHGGERFTLKHKGKIISVFDTVIRNGGERLEEIMIQNLFQKAAVIEAKEGETSLKIESGMTLKCTAYHPKPISLFNNSSVYSDSNANKLAEGKTYLEALKHYADNPKELLEKYRNIEYSLVSVKDGKLETIIDNQSLNLDNKDLNLSSARGALIRMVRESYERTCEKENAQRMYAEMPKKRKIMTNIFKKHSYEKVEK